MAKNNKKEVNTQADFEKRSALFKIDLELLTKKYQVGLQALIEPLGPVIKIINLKK